MKLVVSRKAARDVAAIHAHVATDSMGAADRLIDRIYSRVERLTYLGFPDLGVRSRIDGTRQIVEGRYVIVYRYDPARDEIVVLSVTHGARRR